MFAKYGELDRSCDMLRAMIDQSKEALSCLASDYSEIKNRCPINRYFIMKEMIKCVIDGRDSIIDSRP